MSRATTRSSSTMRMLAWVMGLACVAGETDAERRPILPQDGECPTELFGQVADELQAERSGAARLHAGRKPHTVVPDHKPVAPAGLGVERHADVARAPAWKCVLERVADQLVDEQRAAHRSVEIERGVGDAHLQRDARGID